jgi:hypothetical protein
MNQLLEGGAPELAGRRRVLEQYPQLTQGDPTGGRPWPSRRPSSARHAGPVLSSRKQVSKVSNGDRGMASIAAVAPCLWTSRSLIWGEGPYQDLAGALTRR